MDAIQKELIKAGRKDLADKYYKKITSGNEAVEALLALKNALKKGMKPLVRDLGKDTLSIATGGKYSVKVKVLGWYK